MLKTIQEQLISIKPFMSELFKEEDFYKDNGGPTEEYTHCSYTVPVLNEMVDENDYDQF